MAERLAAMRKQAGGAAKFAAVLKRQGLDEAALCEQVRRGRRVDKLVERVTAAATETPDEEVRAHFEAHRAEYRRGERAQAGHILVKPESDTPQARDAARAKLEAIRSRVQAGGRFADEAAAHSACPSGRKTGGSLGWFERGAMTPAFDKTVFGMAVGELSEIVETPFGLHLIHKTGQEPAADAAFEDVREGAREFLRRVRHGEALAKHVAELRSRAKIEITEE